MADKLREALKRVLAEVDEEERSETLEARLLALEEKQEAGGTITTAQIIAALEGASDEELEALHGTVVDRLAREVEERREGQAGNGETDEQRATREAAEAAEAERLRLEQEGGTTEVRPGRKQGQAYNWETDDDGNVVKLDVARIWNEPDEDDEVPLPAAAGGEQ